MIFSVILIILFFILVVLKLNPKSSIVSSFMASLLFNYFNGHALFSIPGKCNPDYGKNLNRTQFLLRSIFHIIVNIILSFLTIFWFSTEGIKKKAMEDNQNPGTNENINSNQIEYADNDAVVHNNYINQNEENEEIDEKTKIYFVSKIFIKFHFVMLFFSFYISKPN